jgi:tRNA (guanosine-2'-O-)-methyltransferase
MVLGPRRKKKIEDVARARQRGLVLVLEDIHDPHNAAAILRSADAFGVQDVFVVYEQETYANPKRVGKSSSSSANKWLNFTVYRSSAACVAALKEKGYRVVVTALGPQAMPMSGVDFTDEPLALVVGNEHRGVSPDMLAAADVVMYIPMRGMVQSLNVSVAAAVSLYEITRQREASGKDFLLGAREAKQLMKDFFER